MVPQPLIESDRLGVFKKMGKTEETAADDVKYMQDWLAKQHHLPSMEDWRIEIMLVRSKFSLEKTKKRIDRYYTMRTLEPDIFSNWDPWSREVQQAFDVMSYVTMPKLTKDRCQISVSKFTNASPDLFIPQLFFKVGCMFHELQLQNYYYYGNIVVFDMTDCKIGHVLKLNPALAYKVLLIATKTYPYKLKGVHYINGNAAMGPLLKFAKIAIPDKIYKLLHVHKDYESLYEYVPKELLPVEYGGNEPPFMDLVANVRTEMEKSGDFLQKEVAKKPNEAKRAGELDNSILGSMHGSFRTLQLD